MSKSIIIVIFLWLAMIGVIVFLIVPLGQESLDLRRANFVLEKQITELNDFIPRLEQLKSDYQTHLDKAEKIRGALASREEIPELISEITTLSSKNSLLISALGFSIGGQTTALIRGGAGAALSEEGMPVPTIGETTAWPESITPAASSGLVTINLSLLGPYESLKTFLEDAEKDLRILDLRTLSFSAGESGNLLEQPLGLDIYTYSLVFETYFLPD